MDSAIYFIADVVLGGAFLWVAARITKVDLFFRETVMCVTAAAIVGLVPSIGWLLSVIVLFYTLKMFSQVNVWPDLVLMVIVSRLVTIVTLSMLGAFP